MATAAPHVKLLRQLASAKDDYLSGAFDISWDGAKATLYLVFGRPSHAVFDTDQAQIEGEAAIDALLAELPRTFAVSDWRRAMSPQETLSISIDELAGPFVRLAGSYADDPVGEESREWWSADDSSPDLAFGLSDFPLLPGGRPLWAETSPENVNLAERLAELPPSILILTGAKLRAAAVVSGGDLIDAVWIDDEDQARGEAAGMALLGATKGSLAGYALDDPRVAEALTMLWRLPLAVSGIEMSWLDPASMLAAFRADGLDRVLVIDAPVRGIALFSRGGLVAVYSETQRSAVASPERLRSLLSQARGRLTVLERKPRPVAASAARSAPSATDFFGVLAPEAPAEATPEAEAPAADDGHADREESIAAEGEAADVAGIAGPDADAHTDGAAESATETDVAAEHAPDAAWSDEPTSEPAADGDAAATPSHPEFEAVSADAGADGSEPPPPPPPDAEHVLPPSDSDRIASEEHAPPPSDTDLVASEEHAPPPPAPDAQAAPEPEPGTKRHWWSRGSRKNKAASTPTPETIAAEAAAAHEAAEAATFTGWSVRQPDPEAPPAWARARDHVEGSDAGVEGALAPPPGVEAATDTTEAAAPAPTWSVIEPGTVAPRTPSAPAAAPDDSEDQTEFPAATQPETAASQGWSARDVLADSVGWYQPADAVHAEAAHETSTDETPAVPDDEALDATSEPGDERGDDAASPVAAEAEGEHADATVAEAEGVHDDATVAEAEDEHGDVDAEADHGAPSWYQPVVDSLHEPEPAGETDTEPVAAAGEEPADVSEHDPSAHAEPAHDFWAEFASSDPDADAGTAAETEAEPAEGSEAAPVETSAGGDQPDLFTRKPSERTVAPWSWPLAESEPAPAPAPHPSRAPLEEDPEPATAAASSASESDDWAPVFEGAGEQSFFQRDEPIGSQFVDFDEVRTELVQIGIVWLGEANAVPVTALLRKTRSTIDDFVATIDTIRGLHLEGQDPASVQAMAREMHQQAAERLCGA